MKVIFRLRMPVLVALLLVLCGGRVAAQNQNIFFSVTPSATNVTVGSNLTYTISMTNFFADFALVFVTNSLSLNVDFISFSSSPRPAGLSTNGSTGVLILTNFPIGGTNRMTLTLTPVQAGLLTNTVTVATFSALPPSSTNVVTQVSAAQTDLRVSLAVSPSSVLVGDSVTCSIITSNAGPSAASGVQLTLSNFLSAATLLSASRTNTITNNLILFSLGTIASGSSKTTGVTIQPTNAGNLPLSAFAVVPGVTNISNNNIAQSTLVVSGFLSTNLVVSNISALAYDPQTGLMKQRVRLSNIGTNPVPSVRVIVSGLSNQLFNAVGTNNGNPYVVYATTLDTNQSVDLGLKYFVPTRRTNDNIVPDSNYTAVGVSQVDLSVPAGLGTAGGPFSFTQVVRLRNGGVLIEFESTAGTSYTVVYSSNATFTNAMIAPPSVVAPANRTQWIDEGPPETLSAPTNSSMRFYRVLRN